MSSIPQPRFYVYVLSRPNGSPFYVGKGANKRIAYHRWQAKSGYKSPKCSVIRKIWDNGQDYHHQFVFRTNDESKAFSFECALIAGIGRDLLCNQTDGGEGRSGNEVKPETRARRSIAMKALYANPEARAKTGVASRLAQSTPEAKAKLSAAQKAKWANPEFRAKIKEINRNTRPRQPKIKQGFTVEERARRSERARNKLMSPETRAKISAAMKARMSDPELRAKFVNSGQLARKLKHEADKG